MTRKQERRRRVLAWAAWVACGVAGACAALAYMAAPLGWVVAAAVLGCALALGHRRMIAAPGVAILTYHSVSATPGWLPWSREIAVHPATFARHLATLARMDVRVIGTRALVARGAAGAPPPARGVVLHFDDGYLDNHLNAAPLLRQHGFPATFFPSLDFIEPCVEARGAGGTGYMNWGELRALEGDPLFEVEPHGVAHARVPVSDEVVGRLEERNWREHAWMQWAAMPGPKHAWYVGATPPAVPLGSAIPASGLALAVRAWRDGAQESVAAFEGRIHYDLAACRTSFETKLGQPPTIFCWPENKVGAEGRRIARTLGYRATTAGTGRNAPGEPADVLSRIHIGDRAIGIRWLPAEALYLRASVYLMQGNHYWYLVVAPMNVLRRVVFAIRRRLGNHFA